ncbi:sugar ABC transporter ATP-binding protein [Demequina sp. TTPB684]|uniref:sugar ABC transporter ATP-binding protein n=1 Tax=unclassified Demequina TaxID=2620311 RepID=UPI001CF4FB4D|nr:MULTISPECIES: sugar ABC transporter ATP-binding protein [unclassified Demequina]MCB2413518.1 sugar ABC transporter ATP-binding protein [Demequina sp. TTPB684]UPU87162.1 sugar ABC transporter ATP-binding protein [Demequina sp. TMPB413]
MGQPTPLVEIEHATVRFGTTLALDDVALRLYPGEVHSLMGENGAGKSTLIKALTGALRLDSGTVTLAGESMHFATPHDAHEHGISAVYQEINLLPNLSVAENIRLGREGRRFGLISPRRMEREAAEVLADLGLSIDPHSPLGSHPVAVQQLVAIARAISTDVRVLVLDEPTSSLDSDEVAELFRVIRDLKQRGVAILFISHFLDQVYEISDRITVLRDGALVGEYLPTDLLRIDLMQKMLGHDAPALTARPRPASAEAPAEPYLSARGVTSSLGIVDADVDLAEGEVLGVAGLLGSGRTALARALTGVDRLDRGALSVDGKVLHFDSPRKAMKHHVAYSSENRRTEGIVGDLSVLDNITLALQAQRGVLRKIPPARQRELAASWAEALRIRPGDLDRPVRTLSGGNQQKVMLARLLALSPRVLVLDEPTRGIDVGAKVEVQNLVADLATNGLSVVFISAELEEVLRVSDRVAVLRDARIVDTMESATLTVDAVLALVARPESMEEGE